eukprot:5138999-Prymnesium_polylepis.1
MVSLPLGYETLCRSRIESLAAAASTMTKQSRMCSCAARRIHCCGSPHDGERRPSETMIASCI